jgi:oligopeptide/dipeptide ABC transporter ATP-binding protein
MRLIQTPGRTVGGKILLRNKPLLDLNAHSMTQIRGQDVSMVFQDPMTYLNPVFNVGNQIVETIQIHQHMGKKEAKEKTIGLLRSTGLPEPEKVFNYFPHQLSGGMRQRILIAMALSCNPSLLIADEPTTALDVTVQAQILQLIKETIKQLGTALLLITHDLGIVADMCDTVYVMYAGKIVESGTVWQIFRHPLHPYTSSLLECVLSIDQFKKEIKTIEGTVPYLINPPSGCRYRTRCPFVMEKCSTEEPPLVEIENGHAVACHLHAS